MKKVLLLMIGFGALGIGGWCLFQFDWKIVSEFFLKYPFMSTFLLSVVLIMGIFFYARYSRFKKVLKTLAKELHLKFDYFLCEGKILDSSDLEDCNLFHNAIGGIFENYFVRIGSSIERPGGQYIDYIYIIIRPKEDFQKHETIMAELKNIWKLSYEKRIAQDDRKKELCNKFYKGLGEAIILNKDQRNLIESQMPDFMSYLYQKPEYAIFKNGVIIKKSQLLYKKMYIKEILRIAVNFMEHNGEHDPKEFK